MSDDFRCYLDPESVSPHLFCSICQEVFVDPYRAPCGHSFCKTCISQWLKNNKTCPEDRKKLTLKDMHHDFILENIIGDQKVACPYRTHGCNKVIPLSTLGSHIKDCSSNPSNIPDFLKDEFNLISSQNSNPGDDADGDNKEDAEPMVYVPLKLRLFQAGGEKREQLVKAFSRTGCSPKSKIRKLMQLIDDE